MARQRPIGVGFPSGAPYMTLWYKTEDEREFPIKAYKRGKPYVLAYGIKYYLTDAEIKTLHQLLRLYGDMDGLR